VSVKIQWDDGEQVTWRRDSLAGRPVEILDAEAAGDGQVATETNAVAEATTGTDPVEAGAEQTEPAIADAAAGGAIHRSHGAGSQRG
jgi:hypothetical protein